MYKPAATSALNRNMKSLSWITTNNHASSILMKVTEAETVLEHRLQSESHKLFLFAPKYYYVLLVFLKLKAYCNQKRTISQQAFTPANTACNGGPCGEVEAFDAALAWEEDVIISNQGWEVKEAVV